MNRFFLTVDWCNNGKRGIFCSADGSAFYLHREHTEAEIRNILSVFSTVLSPKSLPFSEEQIKEYKFWHPLAEYSNQYGIALKANRGPNAPNQP